MVCTYSVNVNIYIFGKTEVSDLQQTSYKGVLPECNKGKEILKIFFIIICKSLAISDYNITMIAAIAT